MAVHLGFLEGDVDPVGSSEDCDWGDDHRPSATHMAMPRVTLTSSRLHGSARSAGYALHRGPRQLLDAGGRNKNVAGVEGDGAIPRLDVERSLEHKKEIIRVVMPMPGMAR